MHRSGALHARELRLKCVQRVRTAQLAQGGLPTHPKVVNGQRRHGHGVGTAGVRRAPSIGVEQKVTHHIAKCPGRRGRKDRPGVEEGERLALNLLRIRLTDQRLVGIQHRFGLQHGQHLRLLGGWRQRHAGAAHVRHIVHHGTRDHAHAAVEHGVHRENVDQLIGGGAHGACRQAVVVQSPSQRGGRAPQHGL